MTNEEVATLLFQTAIRDGQAAELLMCLFDGGAATVDARTNRLVLITKEQVDAMGSYE